MSERNKERTIKNELLEFAAKAIGIEHQWCPPWSGMYIKYSDELGYDGGSHWDPLVDDSDALRLAIALKLIVQCTEFGFVVVKYNDIRVVEYFEDNEVYTAGRGEYLKSFEATRLAIVKVAAEIGRRKSVTTE